MVEKNVILWAARSSRWVSSCRLFILLFRWLPRTVPTWSRNICRWCSRSGGPIVSGLPFGYPCPSCRTPARVSRGRSPPHLFHLLQVDDIPKIFIEINSFYRVVSALWGNCFICGGPFPGLSRFDEIAICPWPLARRLTCTLDLANFPPPDDRRDSLVDGFNGFACC